jgi:hypothetical protein
MAAHKSPKVMMSDVLYALQFKVLVLPVPQCLEHLVKLDRILIMRMSVAPQVHGKSKS